MKKITIYHLSFIILFFLLTACGAASANNMAVSNVAFAERDSTLGTAKVQFDLSWQNSWRNSINYDAVWVFIKYSTDSGATWSHATLKTAGTNPSGFSAGTGIVLDIIVPTDKKGAFLQRSANGYGTVSNTSVKLVWDYGTDGLAATSTALVKVFAIEMVYVPSGAFYAGDGNGTGFQSAGSFFQAAYTPVLVTNSLKSGVKCASGYGDAQLVSPGIGISGTAGLDNNNDTLMDNANYPTGYNAFYVMKYSVSQGQIRDFLNTLTRTQQNSNIYSQTANAWALASVDPPNRSAIKNPAAIPTGAITFGCDLNQNGTFDEVDDGEWIVCSYLTWRNCAAYSDWAGLRPMTELEFEKACRGTNNPLYGEYPWGTTDKSVIQTSGGNLLLKNSGRTSEEHGQIFYGLYNNNAQVARCGFAATALHSNRFYAAASYYGIMDLTGNGSEYVVNIATATGRNFAGTHGDGSLSSNGYANNSDWPGYSNGEVTGYDGSGAKDSFQNGATGKVSERQNIMTDYSAYRGSDSTFRAVRNAP